MDTALHIRACFQSICYAILPLLLLLAPASQADGLNPVDPLPNNRLASPVAAHPGLPSIGANLPRTPEQLIVIGFMGGDVNANNLVHREALMAKDLRQRYPLTVHAAVFANHDGLAALKTVLQLLGKNGDSLLTPKEKSAARIVIYGHSWGASETVTLARRLNKLNIPVLLTVQVDSVQKSNENDGRIPPNVRKAINFYQLDGLLHGRSVIEAMDPAKTDILGNFESTYRRNPISCAGYPWYARAFMKSHIEIENDPLVWNRIEALIGSEVAQSGAAE